MNYNKKLEKIKNNYIKYSKNKENLVKRYVNNLITIYNPTGQPFQHTYDLKEEYRKKYIDLIQRSKFIENEVVEKGYKSLFITLTLNTHFHRFKQQNGRYIDNPLYDEENTTERGYRVLQNTFRNIIKELNKNRSNREKIEYKFIKVFELHKNLTPHIHILLFVKDTEINNVIKVIENKIQPKRKSVENTKIKYNYNIQHNNDIGRTEIEIIENVSRSVSYLLKYIRKQYTDTPYLLDGWSKRNKIRLMTTSKIPLIKSVYNKIYHYIDNDIKENLLKNNRNILDYIVNNTKMTYVENGFYEIKHNPNDNPIFSVEVYKKEVSKFVKIDRYNLNLLEVKKLRTDEEKYYYLLDRLTEKDYNNFMLYTKGGVEDIDLGEEYCFVFLYDYLLEFLQNEFIEIKYKIIDNIVIYKNGVEVYNKDNFETFRVKKIG